MLWKSTVNNNNTLYHNNLEKQEWYVLQRQGLGKSNALLYQSLSSEAEFHLYFCMSQTPANCWSCKSNGFWLISQSDFWLAVSVQKAPKVISMIATVAVGIVMILTVTSSWVG